MTTHALERLIRLANIARWAAQHAPDVWQQRAADTQADRLVKEMKEGSR